MYSLCELPFSWGFNHCKINMEMQQVRHLDFVNSFLFYGISKQFEHKSVKDHAICLYSTCLKLKKVTVPAFFCHGRRWWFKQTANALLVQFMIQILLLDLTYYYCTRRSALYTSCAKISEVLWIQFMLNEHFLDLVGRATFCSWN